MKYLKIESNKGFYWNGTEHQEVDKISKDDLLILLNSAESDDFEMDNYDEGLIGNKAHQVIYENLHSKFQQFLNDKTQFKSEVDNLYKEAIGKYSVDIESQELDDLGESEDETQNEDEDINPEDIPF